MSVRLTKDKKETSLKAIVESWVDFFAEHPVIALLAAWFIGVPVTVGAWYIFDAIFAHWNFFSVTSFIFLVAWSILYASFIVSATILGFIE